MTEEGQIVSRRGSRRQPEASRRAILQAALVEFAQEGLAGARMDAIAGAAHVNKALLYYYFRDKQDLYAAVLDDFFLRLRQRVAEALNSEGEAGQRLLCYARAHFDCIAESPHYARLFQGELMSAGRGGSSHLNRIVEQYIRPIALHLMAVLQQGIESGEFRKLDPTQFAPTMVGMIVHYFVAAPVVSKLVAQNPFSAEALQRRRAAVLDFIAASIFTDQSAGVKLAAAIASRDAASKLAAHIAEQPTLRLRGEPLAKRMMREPPPASMPPSRPAPAQAQSPAETPVQNSAALPMQHPADLPTHTEAAELAHPPTQVGYKWIDRWFPDFETAMKVLQEESKRYPRTKRADKPRTRPTKPGEEGGPE